jgi:hypothetical protein
MSGRQSEADKEAARLRAERIESAQLKDLRELMDSPAFRRYLKRYLSICSVFKTTFTGNSETFFKEGQRPVGTTMFGELMQACPQRFHELMAEVLASDEAETSPSN